MEMQVVHEIQDLTYLSWTKVRKSSGTAGSFLKAFSDFGTEKVYYKLSNFDSYKGIVGHECVNELIVDRLLTILGVEHLHYQLIHADILVNDKAYTTYLCASADFKQRGEGKIALDAYYQAECYDGESMMEFCVRNGWEEYVYQMLAVDFLILNRDRHGANLEVLRNREKKTIRLAPLFDHGLSLIFNCMTEDAVEKVDVLEDKLIQCCVGSNSSKENLWLIPKDRIPKFTPLKESDRKILFEDLNGVLPAKWEDKIWEMIWRRWECYESFCNQR